jgi:hypothetical protein
MKIFLILALLVAAVVGYTLGLDYMERRGPVRIPEGTSSHEAAIIQHKFDQQTQIGALFMSGMFVGGVFTLGGIAFLLTHFSKVPAAFREGYRDGKR